jgi:hypothetical protein
MNPVKLVTRPIRHLADAVLMPFKALFVVGLCGLINWMSFAGTWWVKWVALGMGIAVLVTWARAAKTLLMLGLVAWAGWLIYKRWGQAGRERFDAWVREVKPQAAEVVDLLRSRPAQQRMAETGRAG